MWQHQTQLMYKVEDNKRYQFIPFSVASFDNCERRTTLLLNDVFEKYEASTLVNGHLIICNDISKLKSHTHRLKYESYADYLTMLENRPSNKDAWIYNILDGISEQDKIIYQDEECVIIPTYIWDGETIERMHLLCMPRDKTIRSLRDLTGDHLTLLRHMRSVTLQVIQDKYGLAPDVIKQFVHYDPSTYHFHIHFVNISHTECGSSVEYSHDLDGILLNLSIKPNYYQEFDIKRRC